VSALSEVTSSIWKIGADKVVAKPVPKALCLRWSETIF